MQQGFFNKQDIESRTRPDGRVLSCASCGLYKNCEHPKIKPFGNFKKHILIIGDTPSPYDDRIGKLWQGPNGRLLQKTLLSMGVDLFEDCLCFNALRCCPLDDKGQTRPPTVNEMECCSRFIIEDVMKYQPKVIILLGTIALSGLLNHRWKKGLDGITKWRGFTIPDQEFGSWVCPTFHPIFITKDDRSVETIWLQDLQRAISLVDKPFPKYKEPHIHYIDTLEPLRNIKTDLVAIDFETTGIKPHADGHRIICAAVAVNETDVYAFLLPKKRIDRDPFTKLLANNLIGKMAHNMKYEETWSVVRLRQPVQNWAWDSMLAAHLLDNRPGVTGLKFQVYVNFGIIDYDSTINPYLQSSGKDGNEINNIESILEDKNMVKELLKYCALDAIYTYRLSIKQFELIDYKFLPF